MKKTFVTKAIRRYLRNRYDEFHNRYRSQCTEHLCYRTRRKHDDRFYAECRWHLDYAEAEIRIPIRCQRKPGGKEGLPLECR